ncbi:sensor histidine kinase YesM [Catenibacillus scindens]|uniref:Sensor histidine kinase YesM n=1 Tax=Catenibacillus scindens TaxID=673271 RepID=A0A7W8M763_9FIRM|nr:sensor histidine kinase [Catenibacillus scindens]MBB5266111.1 sensor histidine kinase YesM [Catenibacillus scindens]
MKKTKKSSGIQRKYLKYTAALLGLALLLSSLGVLLTVRNQMTRLIVDKYEYMTERMGITLENMFKKTDETTAECILYDDVQQSLQTGGLEEVNHISLSKYFAYIDLEHVADYCYVDNKGNVYTRSYSDVSYEDIKDSGFERYLGDDYSKTKWFWTKDTLFGTEDNALFIGRYVRSLDYAHEPGMLFFKMEDGFLREVTDISPDLTREAAVGIVDREGQLCLSFAPENFKTGESVPENIGEMVVRKMEDQQVLSGEQVTGGVLSVYRDETSGLSVFSFVPDRILNQRLISVFLVLVAIYLLVTAVAVVLSIYFSRRFTKPIQVIKETMTEFDGNNFDRTIGLNTHTELDEIGRAYNKMLKNIQRLLDEIKAQERELRAAELNTLISQINPHFLYNTLDTIYMLARINGEETTMRMIQALSKYLRLSLSKGSDIVTVEDELENVRSYMEIQQIRNENLFSYDIDCCVDPVNTRILKLILQPIVENSVKYGFQDIYEGGRIVISVEEKEGNIYLNVYNNGTPIEESVMEKINKMNTMPVSELKNCFEDKKHGYGVMNILTRLRLKYGDGAGFYCQAQKDGTICTIKIPGGVGEKDEN